MAEHFAGAAYNFRRTMTGKEKFESFSDASFDIVDGVLWFNKKRKFVGNHPAVNFAIGPAGEVDIEVQRQIAFMIVVARGPGGTGVLKVNSGVAASLQTAVAQYARAAQKAAAPEPTTTVDLPTQIRELAQLRDDGLLTEEEFAAQKARLLSQT